MIWQRRFAESGGGAPSLTLALAALLSLAVSACGAAPVVQPGLGRSFGAARAAVERAGRVATLAAFPGREFAQEAADRGSEAVQGARFEEALEWFRQAEAGLPNYFSYRADYAWALWLARGDHEGAFGQLNRCLELMPEHLECRRIRGLLHNERGDTTGALEDLQEVAQGRPDDYELREQIARILMSLGQEDQAIAALEAIRDGSPSQIGALLLLAQTREARGEIPQALEAFRLLRERHRDPIRGATYLYHFLGRHGMTREASQVEREINRIQRERSPAPRRRPL